MCVLESLRRLSRRLLCKLIHLGRRSSLEWTPASRAGDQGFKSLTPRQFVLLQKGGPESVSVRTVAPVVIAIAMAVLESKSR